MSEVKGTLLGIVLAISVFSIIFAIIQVAARQSTNTVSGRMKDIVETEPDEFEISTKTYSLTY